MLERIHDLYSELEKNKVMLSFKGELAPELITVIVQLVERKLDGLEPDAKIRKRVFNVVVECLQNLYHHNNQLTLETSAPSESKEPHGVVMIAHSPNGYSVLTGNFMAGAEVQNLKDHLDKINASTPEALREWYRAKLADGKYSAVGGGGLGMIDIARRSGGKLDYAFVPYDENHAFFSLNVNVTA
ncbi:MAG TPA: SiaB family protein kinase [Flavobacteriales bacterium]|nr:SiaB family protein kinase [Flavobacteriales bacterium]